MSDNPANMSDREHYMPETRISVRLDSELYRNLQAAAGSPRSRSALVREALAKYLGAGRSRQSALDRARKAGLIGVAKSLPADLSTDPRHLRGFGR